MSPMSVPSVSNAKNVASGCSEAASNGTLKRGSAKKSV